MREFAQVTKFYKWFKSLGEVARHQALRQFDVLIRGKDPRGFETIKDNRLPVTDAPVLEARSIEVVEWHDKPEPKGHADCVAILIESPHFNAALERAGMLPPDASPKLMIRFKTDEAADEIIDALKRHRANVWPTVRR